MEATPKYEAPRKDDRYSDALGAFVDEAFNCQSVAEGLAALINHEDDMAWRLARVLACRLGNLAGSIDELNTHGPNATEAANG